MLQWLHDDHELQVELCKRLQAWTIANNAKLNHIWLHGTLNQYYQLINEGLHDAALELLGVTNMSVRQHWQTPQTWRLMCQLKEQAKSLRYKNFINPLKTVLHAWRTTVARHSNKRALRRLVNTAKKNAHLSKSAELAASLRNHDSRRAWGCTRELAGGSSFSVKPRMPSACQKPLKEEWSPVMSEVFEAEDVNVDSEYLSLIHI